MPAASGASSSAAGSTSAASGGSPGASGASVSSSSAGSVPGGGKPSTSGSSGATGTGGTPLEPPSGACDHRHDELIDVGTAGELAQALASASAGTMIRLPDSELRGAFKTNRSGNAQKAIVLCGTRKASLSAGDTATVLLLEGDYWVLSGFTVSGGQKGILLDGAQHNLLTDLAVRGTGNEAVHFRSGSADNVLEWSEISDTGSANAEFGEGVYIGSAVSQWEKFTGSAGTPDRADRNVVRNNKIGPNVRAELIDVKEGTTGGSIQGNTFDGAGIVDAGFADSWVDVKGNGYIIENNQGTTSPSDGFQVHVVEDGWGNDNVFRMNRATVNAGGYGFRISQGASGTVVACNNMVTGAGAGLSNIGCQN